MEDPSVYMNSLERTELLCKLDLDTKSSLKTDRLRTELKNRIPKNHPIHGYVSQLSQDSLTMLYMTVFENSGYRKYDRMKRALTNEMFKKFPKAPIAGTF